MKGRIPDTTVEEILSRVDIAELIAGYIPLKRAGRNFKALCPFHHEKTPSFMISVEKQIYHCFGCGAGGNAISFLMQYERLEFPEAVEVLAKKAGVALPERESPERQGILSLTSQLYKVHEAAVAFYRQVLHSPAGAHAKSYLLKRGIKEETIALLNLGFAPDRWDALMSYLRAKGINLSLIEKAGLIVPKPGGGYYDRFRNRVIFPIYDIKSRAIAYGARMLPQSAKPAQPGEEPPKYVNSPETPLYSKGKNLYGINLSKDAIRQEDSAVIVEGYLDFILPFQEGFKNIVASLGTAFTSEQVNVLKRYTHNVIIVYDPDDAGQLASLRALDLFVEEGMNVKVVSLPKGDDPDLFIRNHGVENFKKLIASSRNLLEYKLAILKDRHDVRDIDGKTAIAAEILPTIKKVRNAIAQAEYVRRLAEELDIDEHSVQQELKKTKDEKIFLAQPVTGVRRANAMNPTEKLLVKLMLQETSLIEQLRATLEPADFQDEHASRIVAVLFDLVGQGRHIESRSLISHCHDNILEQLICESALEPEVSQQDKERIVEDCVKRLKSEKVRIKKQYLHEEIRTAQNLGDEQRLRELLQEFHHLTKVR